MPPAVIANLVQHTFFQSHSTLQGEQKEKSFSGIAMRKCWAEVLGNCSDSLSGEHIVSKGLFATDMVGVQGLSWCKDAPKVVGLNSVTRKILCTRHNNTLSPVDQAAIVAFDAFRESVRLTDVRQAMKERRWNIVHLPVDGEGLERWFLKTLINVTLGGDKKIGPKSIAPGEPSSDLVEIAYGQRKFPQSAGLHYSAEAGETIDSEDRVTIIPFFDSQNECVLGGTFYFRGFRFMLCLVDEGFTGNVTLVHKDGRAPSRYAQPRRHLKHFKVTVGPTQRYVSHSIDFVWN